MKKLNSTIRGQIIEDKLKRIDLLLIIEKIELAWAIS